MGTFIRDIRVPTAPRVDSGKCGKKAFFVTNCKSATANIVRKTDKHALVALGDKSQSPWHDFKVNYNLGSK